MLRDALMAGLVRLQRSTGATDEWQLRADNERQQRGLPPFLPRRRKSAPSPSRTSVSSAAFVVMGGIRTFTAPVTNGSNAQETDSANLQTVLRHAAARHRSSAQFV